MSLGTCALRREPPTGFARHLPSRRNDRLARAARADLVHADTTRGVMQLLAELVSRLEGGEVVGHHEGTGSFEQDYFG